MFLNVTFLRSCSTRYFWEAWDQVTDLANACTRKCAEGQSAQRAIGSCLRKGSIQWGIKHPVCCVNTVNFIQLLFIIYNQCINSYEAIYKEQIELNAQFNVFVSNIKLAFCGRNVVFDQLPRRARVEGYGDGPYCEEEGSDEVCLLH